MNAIIVGCGRLGSVLANELSDAGHNVTVIEHDAQRLSILGSGFNGVKLRGIEYDRDILLEAGITTADVLFAVTPDENVNITVSLIAKKIYSVPRIISRIVNPNRKFVYESLDIETINPTQVSVAILKERIAKEQSNEIVACIGNYVVLKVHSGREKPVSVLKLESKFLCKISCINRNDNAWIPEGEDRILQSDDFICCILEDQVQRFLEYVKGGVI